METGKVRKDKVGQNSDIRGLALNSSKKDTDLKKKKADPEEKHKKLPMQEYTLYPREGHQWIQLKQRVSRVGQ